MPIPADQRTVPAGSTPVFTAILRHHNGTELPLSVVDYLRLSVWALPSRRMIRDNVDALNANDVFLHATNGTVTWRLRPDDTAIVDPRPGLDSEQHMYRFTWKWTQGGVEFIGSSERDFFVVTKPLPGM